MKTAKPLLICVWDYQQRPSRYVVKELSGKAGLFEGRHITVVLLQGHPMDKTVIDGWLKENHIGFVSDIIGAKFHRTFRFTSDDRANVRLGQADNPMTDTVAAVFIHPQLLTVKLLHNRNKRYRRLPKYLSRPWDVICSIVLRLRRR